tara:strand:+ start:1448 stop:1648 length:201 start_codon:yes stop_codon:yes gene_type:complete
MTKKEPDLTWKKGDKKNKYKLMAAVGKATTKALKSYTKTASEERTKTQALKDEFRKERESKRKRRK